MADFCEKHETRAVECGVPRYLVDAHVVQRVWRRGIELLEQQRVCCVLSDDEFTQAIRDAAHLEAKVRDHGGSYTTPHLAVFGGGPTDSE